MDGCLYLCPYYRFVSVVFGPHRRVFQETDACSQIIAVDGLTNDAVQDIRGYGVRTEGGLHPSVLQYRAYLIFSIGGEEYFIGLEYRDNRQAEMPGDAYVQITDGGDDANMGARILFVYPEEISKDSVQNIVP